MAMSKPNAAEVIRAANGRLVMAAPPKPAKPAPKPAEFFPTHIKRIDDIGRY